MASIAVGPHLAALTIALTAGAAVSAAAAVERRLGPARLGGDNAATAILATLAGGLVVLLGALNLVYVRGVASSGLIAGLDGALDALRRVNEHPGLLVLWVLTVTVASAPLGVATWHRLEVQREETGDEPRSNTPLVDAALGLAFLGALPGLLGGFVGLAALFVALLVVFVTGGALVVGLAHNADRLAARLVGSSSGTEEA